MVKNFIAIIFFAVFCSSTYADVLIAPKNPHHWGYQNAHVKFGRYSTIVDSKVIIPSTRGTWIVLTVFAKNSRPALDTSCQNIIVTDDDHHSFLFEVQEDEKVHCQFI